MPEKYPETGGGAERMPADTKQQKPGMPRAAQRDKHPGPEQQRPIENPIEKQRAGGQPLTKAKRQQPLDRRVPLEHPNLQDRKREPLSRAGQLESSAGALGELWEGGRRGKYNYVQ